MEKKEIQAHLSRIYNELQQIKHDLECLSDEDGYEDLTYAAGDISDAISEVSKAYNK